MDHVAEVHGRDGQSGAEISEQRVLGKRKRGACKDGVPGTEAPKGVLTRPSPDLWVVLGSSDLGRRAR